MTNVWSRQMELYVHHHFKKHNLKQASLKTEHPYVNKMAFYSVNFFRSFNVWHTKHYAKN